MRARQRIGAAVIGLVLTGYGLIGVGAQTGVLPSEPGAGQIVRTPPDAIRVEPAPGVGADRVTVHVTSPTGRHLESGPPRSDPGGVSSTRLTIPLAASDEQGWYTVEWTVAPPAGAAATPESGRWSFGYSPTGSLFEPPPGARGAAVEGSGADHGGHPAGAVAGGSAGIEAPVWIAVAGGTAAFLAAVAGFVWLQRRSRVRSPG